jgi:hypothetical protein
MPPAPAPKAAPTPITEPKGPWAVMLATGPMEDIATTLPIVADEFATRTDAETWIKANYPDEQANGRCGPMEIKHLYPRIVPGFPGP